MKNEEKLKKYELGNTKVKAMLIRLRRAPLPPVPIEFFFSLTLIISFLTKDRCTGNE